MSAKPARRHSLDGLFRPRSVAVIGASRRQGAIGRQVVENLVRGGFTGPVYPVNPHADVVHSIRTYSRVTKIEGPVDCAILVVPPDAVLAAARECGRKGVRGLVVVTAGFREIGGVGIEREAELLRIADRYGMRVIGPNCMGILNRAPAIAMNASFASTYPGPGAVAMVSQSGALGEAILADAAAAGLGVAMFASVGNRVDVTAADLIEYWENDDDVRVILLYLESFGDPARFVEVARRVGQTKPIIAVKSGRSAAGAAAAGSHTGSVAGGDLAADTMFAQCGVLRVESFREMFALAAALLHQPLPNGDAVAVVTNAGGPGILATDALVASGLAIPALQAKTERALRKVLPVEASVHNPVDLIASADAERYRRSLAAVVKDAHVDSIVVLFVSPVMIDAAAVAEAVVEVVADSGKPVLACLMGRQRGNEAIEVLRRAGIVVFRYPEDAAATLQMLTRRRAMLGRTVEPTPKFRVRRSAAAKILDDHADGWLRSQDAEAVLAAYGIQFAAAKFVKKPGEAAEAAHDLGFPVVLKAEASNLVHKTEHRAVRTGLDSSDQVLEAATDLLERLRGKFRGLRLQVQAHAPGHRELLLGMKRDPRFGPVFAVGLGGTLVEVLRDVAVRVAPLDGGAPAEMLQSLKGAALLGEFRGAPAVDTEAAIEALFRLQQLVLDFPRIAEVEINPFIAGARGVASVAVDARLRLGDATP